MLSIMVGRLLRAVVAVHKRRAKRQIDHGLPPDDRTALTCFADDRVRLNTQMPLRRQDRVRASPPPTWDTGVMATRDEVHRLVDGVPEDRVAAIGEVLRAALDAGLTTDQAHRLAEQLRAHPDLTPLAVEPVRTFASAGMLSAEPDLAERVEEILRTEPPGTAA
ncbi:MAG: hypothetical protein ACRDRT_12230 [Pseudonocardiaceae bacterium]